MKHIIAFALAASLSFCAFGEEHVLRLKKATSVIDYSLFALTLRDCRK